MLTLNNIFFFFYREELLKLLFSVRAIIPCLMKPLFDDSDQPKIEKNDSLTEIDCSDDLPSNEFEKFKKNPPMDDLPQETCKNNEITYCHTCRQPYEEPDTSSSIEYVME